MFDMTSFRFLRVKQLIYILSFTTIALNVVNIGISLLGPNYFFEQLHLWYSTTDTGIENYNQSIDIISIGTIKRPEWQIAQQQTFVSHYTVRNFYRINEGNDTDRTCPTDLTQSQFNRIHLFCTRRDEQQSRVTILFGKDRMNFKPINATGWLCAQKRPIDGLYKTLQPYILLQQELQLQLQQRHRNGISQLPPTSIGRSLPKYLIMIDDDTYLNMTFMIDILSKQYSYQQPYLLTGCLLRFNKYNMYRFPFGGYATIMTQKVIVNLIRPIYCTLRNMQRHGLTNDVFNQKVCSRLQQNLIGEQSYFHDGMSVLDLMYTFSSSLLFTKIDEWNNGTGFCFHSDHALGYFFGYYYIGVPDRVWSNPYSTPDNVNERGYSYNYLSREFDTCNNKRLDCGNSTTICHYNNPEHMYDMYRRETSPSTR